MKRITKPILAIGLLVFSLICVSLMLFGTSETAEAWSQLTEQPNAGGLDRLMFSLYPLYFLILSLFGGLSAFFSHKLAVAKATKILSLVLSVIWSLSFFISLVWWIWAA